MTSAFATLLTFFLLLQSQSQASTLNVNSPDVGQNLDERLSDLERVVNDLHVDNQNLAGKVRTLQKGLTKESADDRQQTVEAPVRVKNPVAFTAVVSAREVTGLTLNQTIIFDEVLTNIGFAYDPEAGIFTAPQNGLYFFNIELMVDEMLDVDLHLLVNGRDVANLYADSVGTQTLSATDRAATLLLNRGDLVSVHNFLAGPRTLHGHKFTTFSGFLLHSFEDS